MWVVTERPRVQRPGRLGRGRERLGELDADPPRQPGPGQERVEVGRRRRGEAAPDALRGRPSRRPLRLEQHGAPVGGPGVLVGVDLAPILLDGEQGRHGPGRVSIAPRQPGQAEAGLVELVAVGVGADHLEERQLRLGAAPGARQQLGGGHQRIVGQGAGGLLPGEALVEGDGLVARALGLDGGGQDVEGAPPDLRLGAPLGDRPQHLGCPAILPVALERTPQGRVDPAGEGLVGGGSRATPGQRLQQRDGVGVPAPLHQPLGAAHRGLEVGRGAGLAGEALERGEAAGGLGRDGMDRPAAQQRGPGAHRVGRRRLGAQLPRQGEGSRGRIGPGGVGRWRPLEERPQRGEGLDGPSSGGQGAGAAHGGVTRGHRGGRHGGEGGGGLGVAAERRQAAPTRGVDAAGEVREPGGEAVEAPEGLGTGAGRLLGERAEQAGLRPPGASERCQRVRPLPFREQPSGLGRPSLQQRREIALADQVGGGREHQRQQDGEEGHRHEERALGRRAGQVCACPAPAPGPRLGPAPGNLLGERTR